MTIRKMIDKDGFGQWQKARKVSDAQALDLLASLSTEEQYHVRESLLQRNLEANGYFDLPLGGNNRVRFEK